MPTIPKTRWTARRDAQSTVAVTDRPLDESGSRIERALRRLMRAWRGGAAGRKRDDSIQDLAPDLPEPDLERVRKQIESCLAGRGGEVSARRRAAELGHSYRSLSEAGRERFLRLLASDYGIDQGAVRTFAAAVVEAEEGEALDAAEDELRRALVAPRVRLFTQFNALPEGVKFLVDMRADLMRLGTRDRGVATVERDLKDLLVSWFDIGFLELRRITWEAPAHLLEKLIAYEAVHEIRSWDDLKNRLDSDRCCYAFFHPRMPDEPLIFIEVALVNGMADNVEALLDEDAPAEDPTMADTAIFYSISNAQRGLAGVSFGEFLVKRVVDDIARILPNIKTFATLSPVPGFRAWLDRRLDKGEALLTGGENRALAAAVHVVADDANFQTALEHHAAKGQDQTLQDALRAPLLRLCARYLLEEKRGSRARDRVAHFHLANGARLERLNWPVRPGAAELRRSYGIMVNYVYAPDDIEANHEAYRDSGAVAASDAVKSLLVIR